MRVAFTTWQFVRLMVRLEETRGADPDRAGLWAEWRADWALIDAELERLRDEDFAAFSDLMMEREVVFEDVPAAHAAVAAAVLAEVAGELAAERTSAGRARRRDLDFERAELERLAADLARSTGAGD